MGFSVLSDTQLDALREISNIGMEHAATAMSQLIGRTIHLKVPSVALVDIAAVPDILGGAERLVVGVYLQILGDATGSILIIFPRESAGVLLNKLIPSENTRGGAFGELEISALKEVGNILSSAFLNALGKMLSLALIPSVPMLSCDMVGAVIDYVLIELGEIGDTAMLVETELHAEGERMDGQFFMLPDPGSLRIILSALGVDGA